MNDKNNPSDINFEDLLRKIEQEQPSLAEPKKTEPPKEELPKEEPSQQEPMTSAEEFVPKHRGDFKINITDEELDEDFSPEEMQPEEEETPQIPNLVQPAVHEDNGEFATRNIDLEKEIERDRQQKKSHKTAMSLVYLACVLAVSGLLSVFIINTAQDVFGLAKPDQDYEINLGEDTTLSAIAPSLDKAGIIKSAAMFRLYAGMRYTKDKVPAGEYLLNSKMSYDEVILELITESTEAETVKVAFPEGLNIVEVANLLEENNVCSAADFLAAARDEYGFDFEAEIPQNELLFCRLEGYIFPNTHEFYVEENPKSVIKRFLRDFQKNVMTAQLTERMKEMGMSLHETITLASMIQEEASNLEDMYKVSSVFHNRLRDSHDFPKLQSDVTYFYAYNTIDQNIEIRNQKILDAYNTYECDGLPVGPITNPGLDAIKAALYPDETSYYYFVTDVNGKFYYASTLRGHENNIAAAAKVGDQVHGTDTQE